MNYKICDASRITHQTSSVEPAASGCCRCMIVQDMSEGPDGLTQSEPPIHVPCSLKKEVYLINRILHMIIRLVGAINDLLWGDLIILEFSGGEVQFGLSLLVLILILFILYIRTLCRMKKFYRAYDRFMRGKDMESMEDTMIKQFDRLEALEASDEKKEKQISEIFENLQIVYQKTGLVKYDAFREMSGKLSYALALLDKNNNGFMVNSMYSREGCYSYVKEIIKGESYITLSEEEQEALKMAIESNGDIVSDK